MLRAYHLSAWGECESDRKTVNFVMRRAYPYMLFLTLVCLFLWRPIFKGEALLPGDYLANMLPWSAEVKGDAAPVQWNPLQWDAIAQYYPWRVFYARSMSGGHIPLWNPHQFCGTPFLANGQSAVLYPLNLIFLVVDPISGFTVFAFIHLFLAAVFTYLLMRELNCSIVGAIVSAVVFTFSAFMVLWLELPTFISAATYIPLALLLTHRAVNRRSLFYGLLSGAAVALAFLAGHLQIAFYVLFAVVLWWAWEYVRVIAAEGRIYAFLKVVVPFIGFAIILALISAPQILPSIELAQNSHRSSLPTSSGYSWFISNALKPYRLITAFIPDYFGNPAKRDYFVLGATGDYKHVGSAADYIEYGMYAGILPLMLAMCAISGIRRQPYVGYFALLSFLAIITALGTPINYLFYHLVPGFSALGGPNRILVLYLFGIAALSGFGIDYFAKYAENKINWRGKQLASGTLQTLTIFLILIVFFVIFQCLASNFVVRFTGQSPDVLNASGKGFVIFLLVSLIILLTRASSSISKSLFSILAIALIAADLFSFGINYNPTSDRKLIYPQTKLTTKLKELAGNSRIAPINPDWSLFQTPKALLPPNAAMVYGLYDVQGYDSLYTRQYKDLMYRVQEVDPSPPENGNMVFLKRFPGDSLHTLLRTRLVVTTEDLSYLTPEKLRPDALVEMLNIDGVRVYDFREPRFPWHFNKKIRWIWNGPGCISIYHPFAGKFLWTSNLRYNTQWRAHIGKKQLETIPYKGRISMFAKGPGKITLRYEPFSFRLGLFLMLLGISVLSTIGVYRYVRYNNS